MTRREYEMTPLDLTGILIACRPVNGKHSKTRINNAWKELGERMGFDYTTVRPVDSRDPDKLSNPYLFLAVPKEKRK